MFYFFLLIVLFKECLAELTLLDAWHLHFPHNVDAFPKCLPSILALYNFQIDSSPPVLIKGALWSFLANNAAYNQYYSPKVIVCVLKRPRLATATSDEFQEATADEVLCELYKLELEWRENRRVSVRRGDNCTSFHPAFDLTHSFHLFIFFSSLHWSFFYSKI